MSTQEEPMKKNKEEQDDDGYDEESPKDAMIPQPNTAKIDINAWRKRQSIAYSRNPLKNRRLSRGEQRVKKNYYCIVRYRYYLRLSRGVVYCFYSNVIPFFVRDNLSTFK